VPRFRSLWFIGGVASLTIVGLAVGVGGCTAAHSAGSPAPSPTASRGADRALLAKVLPVPSTAAEQMVFGSSLGVYSLDQFAQEFYKKDPTRAAQDLRADGFVVAAERDWTGNDGRDASVQLIQFQEPSGASTYVGREELTFERNTADVAFAVPSVDHGRGYENPRRDGLGYVTATMIGEQGDVVIWIELSIKGAFDRPAEIALMQQQVAALAAHP
jgi:hypothetical protein